MTIHGPSEDNLNVQTWHRSYYVAPAAHSEEQLQPQQYCNIVTGGQFYNCALCRVTQAGRRCWRQSKKKDIKSLYSLHSNQYFICRISKVLLQWCQHHPASLFLLMPQFVCWPLLQFRPHLHILHVLCTTNVLIKSYNLRRNTNDFSDLLFHPRKEPEVRGALG